MSKMTKESREAIFPENKNLRGAAQHYAGLVIYVICVINVISAVKVINVLLYVYANLRKLDWIFSKVSSLNLPYHICNSFC